MPGPKLTPEEARRQGIVVPEGIRNVLVHGTPEYDKLTPQEEADIEAEGPTQHFIPPSPMSKVPKIQQMLEPKEEPKQEAPYKPFNRSPGLSDPIRLEDQAVEAQYQSDRQRDLTPDEQEILDKMELRNASDEDLNLIADEYEQNVDFDNPANAKVIKHHQMIIKELEERQAKAEAFPKIRGTFEGQE